MNRSVLIITFLSFSSFLCCTRELHVTVNIDECMSDTLSIRYLFDSVEVIQLQNDEQDRMIRGGFYLSSFGDSLFFIMDKHNGNTIRAYNYYGEIVGKMSPHDRDEGGNSMAYDLLVDDAEKVVIVLDPRGKVIRYSLSEGFPFVDEVDFSGKLPAVHNIGKLSDGSYLLFSRSGKRQLYKLVYGNKKVKPIRYSIPKWLISSPFYSSPTPFYYYNDDTFFFDGLNGNIYSVNNNHLTPRIKWDFGNYQMSKKQVPPNKTPWYYKKLVEHISYRVATQFTVAQETDRYVFMHYSFANQGSLLIYDKMEGVVRTLRRTREGFKIIPGAFHNGSMYLLVQSEKVPQFCETSFLADSITSDYCVLKYCLQ